MKKIIVTAALLALTFSLSACRMGMTEPVESTLPDTKPGTVPAPVITVPTLPDPTFETNIPDENVDGNTNGDTGETEPDTTGKIINRVKPVK